MDTVIIWVPPLGSWSRAHLSVWFSHLNLFCGLGHVSISTTPFDSRSGLCLPIYHWLPNPVSDNWKNCWPTKSVPTGDKRALEGSETEWSPAKGEYGPKKGKGMKEGPGREARGEEIQSWDGNFPALSPGELALNICALLGKRQILTMVVLKRKKFQIWMKRSEFKS